MSSEDAQLKMDEGAPVPLGSRTVLPSISHRIYTLIGFAWPSFGFLFLILMCNNAWFALSFPVQWLFPLVCLSALLLGHLIAMWLESGATTRALDYFRRGMPLIFYRRFAVVQEVKSTEEGSVGYGRPAIIFGGRRILLEAVDELYLTFLGLLELKSYGTAGRLTASRASAAAGVAGAAGAAGAPLNRADLLARVPVGALSLLEQKQLIELFRAHKSDIVVNDRLDARLKSPIVKGQAVVSAFGAVILLYALFDVGYATFTWLEMLRDYYGSQLCMQHPNKAEPFLKAGDKGAKVRAVELYEHAEDLRTHPSPMSWAYRALFANGNSAAQLLAIKAETLYWLEKPDEAIEVLQSAIALKPTGYKIHLHLARWLAERGRQKEARAILDTILEKHKDVLLPRLYNQTLVLNDSTASEELYKKNMAELDEEVFGEEPVWPPGNEHPLMEMFRRDDLEFLKKAFFARPK